MATHSGSAGTVKVGSNAVAELKSWTLDQSQDTVETTKLGDTVKTYTATQSSSSGTMDCFWDETDTNGQVAMTIGSTVTLNLYPEGATSGDTYYSGSAIITSVGVSQTHDGIVERSIGFQVTGAVTIGTV
jgi:predicted secreted protein